jgi:sulfate adenylyltransferase
MSKAPHGGTLVDRRVTGETRERLLTEARSLPRISLDERQVSDLDMIGVGAMSPLTGFMGEKDYREVVKEMRLANGTPWPFPITLRTSREIAKTVKDRVALYAPDGNLLAVMDVTERFEGDRQEEARNVFRTDDPKHPGAAAVFAQGDVMLAGDVHVVNRPTLDEFERYHNDPADLRKKFAELGWKTIVGFQTRNPIHRAHEYILKCALELVDGALIHPLVGATVRRHPPMREVREALSQLLPEATAPCCPVPGGYVMGPREAIFHAITAEPDATLHVGRDHAGVGNYYGTTRAH